MFFDQKMTVHVLSGAGIIITLGLLWRYRTSLPNIGAVWPNGDEKSGGGGDVSADNPTRPPHYVDKN
jgi:hypothetical protein